MYLLWLGFVWHSSELSVAPPVHPLPHLPLFHTPSSLPSLCSIEYKDINFALFLSLSDINCPCSHFFSVPSHSPLPHSPKPPLCPIFGNLWRRKWKAAGGEGGRGGRPRVRRTLGCLRSDLHQISRGYQQMAGVGWGSWGCEKRWDKDVRWQARVCGVAANKHSHMARTPTCRQVMCWILAQPSCHPSALWCDII